MTVETESSSRTSQGNDVTTTFPTGFLFFDNAHITVTLIDEDGVETELTENTHYTLTGAGETAGGDVEMVTPPASGESLYIERNTPILQEVDLRPNGRYLPDTLEGMADKLTLIAQENRRIAESAAAIAAPAEIAAGTIVFADKTFLTGDSVEDSFPMNVTVAGGSTGTGFWAVRLRNLDDAAEVFNEPPAIQAAPGAGDNVSLKFCAGLKPNTNYTLRIAAVIP
jgi:hypothetical protein